MEVEQPRAESRAMTFDEASMERSKGFVKSLQVWLHFHLLRMRVSLYVHLLWPRASSGGLGVCFWRFGFSILSNFTCKSA